VAHAFEIELPEVTAAAYLEQADPKIRRFAEQAADAYLAVDK